MTELKQTPLNDQHIALGARMVPFAGYSMPVQYDGIIAEHMAVREDVGVFDISHMGQVFVSADSTEAAAAWLDGLLTNNVASLKPGEGQYTFLLNEAGGVIDDLIVARMNNGSYFLVVNAARSEEDVAWLRDHLVDGISLDDRSGDYAGLAVQGPNSAAAFATMFPEATLPERFCISTPNDDDLIISRTGYTGEDGFELFCLSADAGAWWQACLEAGAEPCGLGCRDTLRLEKCYPLNGNDLDRERTPLQAGMKFAVDPAKPEFIGRAKIADQLENGLPDRLAAIKQTKKSPPPRAGYNVLVGDECVGTICSGGQSPVLKAGISMAYLKTGHHKIGTTVDVEIRGKRYPAEVVRKPFV